MPIPDLSELRIASLGPCRHASPLASRRAFFVDDAARILLGGTTDELSGDVTAPPSFEAAGPRERIFFAPETLTCGIVSCGGLCPGVNNVIRSIVLTLTYAYGVQRILGFRYGYAGLTARRTADPLELSCERVEAIHEHGGTLLGSSRGAQDIDEMVDTLVAARVGALFAIGGDGTMRGAAALQAAIRRRGLPIALVGVPKTIDNDLEWIERSFGFATAVEEAGRVLAAAHAEARGAWNGVGLVKLMGRHAGFIAAHATLGNADVNFCLVPEVPFALRGDSGFLQALEARLVDKDHAVVVVAEGAGQDLLGAAGAADVARDASGNVRLRDVGVFLRDAIARHAAERGLPVTVRYIDPSYILRSLPANMSDAEFCLRLGQHAVHAALAGRTNLLVGYWNQHFTHVPLAVVSGGRRRLDPCGELWRSVLEATGQPTSLGAPAG